MILIGPKGGVSIADFAGHDLKSRDYPAAGDHGDRQLRKLGIPVHGDSYGKRTPKLARPHATVNSAAGTPPGGGHGGRGSRFEISPLEFPSLLEGHMREVPGTKETEELGERLVGLNFPPDLTVDFVTAVCRWGGGDRILGRILEENPRARICAAFREAVSSLKVGSISKALQQVNNLRYLGQVSFASKHLRHLRPAICGTFDSNLQNALPHFSPDPKGYSDFCHYCASIAKELTDKGIPNPRVRVGGVWFVADVEAAFDQKLRGQS